MTTLDPAYFGREQTAVKHRILEHYLIPLPLIVGRRFAPDITFVDCCSGPWNTKAEDQSDSSFAIAIRQLRTAREILRSEGHQVSFRCLFIEKDPAKFKILDSYCTAVTDMEVKPMPGDFVERIPDILSFVNERPNSFPFFFIDPTGWSPLRIVPLTRLLRYRPCEVLINFMTSQIRRWLTDEEKDFGALIGQGAMARIQNLNGRERDDAAAFSYADQVALAGNFEFVCTTAVLNPQWDDTHYHLIYATRHHKGVQEFKAAERNAKVFMAIVRGEAQQRRRIDRTQNLELYPPSPEDQYLLQLRDHHLNAAHEAVKQQLRSRKGQPIPYDLAWATACRFPFVWESDLHEWIEQEWAQKIDVLGMKPNQRVPKCQSGNTLVWNESA